MGRPLGNALTNAPHTNDAQLAAMHLGPCKHVIAPLRPQALAQVVLALGDASGSGHEQCKAKVCRRFR